MIVLTRWKAAAKEEYLARAGQTYFVLSRILDFVYTSYFKNHIIDLTIYNWNCVNFGNNYKT